MNIEHVRWANFTTGTLGTWTLPNGLELFSLERPWLDNKPFVSCIPCGTYELEWDMSGRIREVPRLRHVPGRTQINVHIANYVYQLHGCIALGMNYDVVNKIPTVQQSRKALDLLAEQIQPRSAHEHADMVDKDGNAVCLRISNFGGVRV